MIAIPDAVMLALHEKLEGTCLEIYQAVEQLDLPDLNNRDDDEIEDRLLDFNLERCKGCAWWMETSELGPIEDGDEPGYCEQCRDSRED